MKRCKHFAAMFLATLSILTGADSKAAETVRDLKIGEVAPDFSLPGIDGKTYTLADFKSAKLLMVAFLSNHCPDSHAAENRIKKLVAGLPADHPVRLYAAAEMAKLEQLGFTGEVRGTPEQPGMGALASVSEFEQPRYIPGATRG